MQLCTPLKQIFQYFQLRTHDYLAESSCRVFSRSVCWSICRSIHWLVHYILLIYCDFDHFCGKVVWGGLLGVKRVTLFFPRVCCCLDKGGNRLIEWWSLRHFPPPISPSITFQVACCLSLKATFRLVWRLFTMLPPPSTRTWLWSLCNRCYSIIVIFEVYVIFLNRVPMIYAILHRLSLLLFRCDKAPL